MVFREAGECSGRPGRLTAHGSPLAPERHGLRSVDHRLRLFLDVEVFADAQEEFQCCLKVCAGLALPCAPPWPECPLCPPQQTVSTQGLWKPRVRRPVSAPAVTRSVATDMVLDMAKPVVAAPRRG